MVLNLQFKKTIHRIENYPPDNVGLPIGLAWGWIATVAIPDFAVQQIKQLKKEGAGENGGGEQAWRMYTGSDGKELCITYPELWDWWQKKSFLRYAVPFNLFFGFARSDVGLQDDERFVQGHLLCGKQVIEKERAEDEAYVVVCSMFLTPEMKLARQGRAGEL